MTCDFLETQWWENLGVEVSWQEAEWTRFPEAMAEMRPGQMDWDAVFDGATWFHWTGITPAISAGTAAVCLEAVQTAKERGLTVSCDLNYRKKLWKWGKQPGEVMPDLVKHCNVAIGNEEDAAKVFIRQMTASDRVAIVKFTGKVQVFQECA